jgi:hypothetical protein
MNKLELRKPSSITIGLLMNEIWNEEKNVTESGIKQKLYRW